MTNSKNIDLFKRFLKDFWPKHRSQLYSQLYNTYHPSNYVESFNRPSMNFENALEIVADAVHEGKKLGLIDSSVDWSDIYNYEDSDGYSNPDQEKKFIDDDGVPTLNDQLEIMDNTNLDWVHGILLFDVLEEIVDEFKHYCGENGIDESGMGKCMDEFPPSPNTGSQPKPYAGGTLKQDYYTLYNFMRELERAGVTVTDYMKDPAYPNIIKLVDDGTTDYNEEGGDRNSADWENMRTQTEFEMDAPDRIYEQEELPEPEEETQSLFQKTLKDMGVQFQFVGTFGFGISGMFGMVKDLLEGRYPSLSEGEIILIFLAGLSYLSINLIGDVKRLKSEVEKRGLKEYVSRTVEVLKDFENISLKIAEKAGFTVSSLAELLGYTFLLVPILDVTKRLIEESGFDIVTLSSYLKGALISVGIFYIKNLFNSLVLRLRKIRERRAGENIENDIDDEMVEEGRITGKLLVDKFKKSTVMTESKISELSLLDETEGNKELKWIVNEDNRVKWVNTPTAQILKEFKDNQVLFTKSNISEVTDKFKDKDPKDLNNYNSIYELNNITKLLIHKSKLHEEVYMSKIAEKATTDVCKDIFEAIRSFDGVEEYYELPTDKPFYGDVTDVDGEIMYEYGDLVFDVELTVYRYDIKETFNVDAEMGGEHDDTIFVDIILGDDFSEQDYENLYIILSEYVRHEIEHILQEIDPERPDIIDKDDKMSPFDYYTQEHEVDAQKVGFERRAKMEDKSVEEVIKDYLEYRQGIDKLSDKEKQDLIGKLTN